MQSVPWLALCLQPRPHCSSGLGLRGAGGQPRGILPLGKSPRGFRACPPSFSFTARWTAFLQSSEQ
eukprot:9200083-Pyramimonas_sp.AAC.1